ncbi:MAG: hypothetical protein CM15mP74_19030 [Halieaceae bacterium]|nr:MAG: hypothetical protein CM15mP74_19030 [Halieaceae bacterium]
MTHSLLWSFIVSSLTRCFLFRGRIHLRITILSADQKQLPFKAVFGFAALGFGTHGLLDACTTYGTQLLWPLPMHASPGTTCR